MVKFSRENPVFSFQLVVALVCLLAFSSCDKINETIKIPLESITIELDNILVEDSSSQKSAFNYFNVMQTIDSSFIKGLSEEAVKYQSHIESIEADSACIIITTTDLSGTVVEEFLLKADGLSDFGISEYLLGMSYMNGVEAYITQFMLKLLKDNSIDINISGKTDVQSGEKLQVKITLTNLTLIAKVLKIN